ncbi:non-ribosomal peptide synthetase [Streptomyces sp. NBC_00568]|uniref:non-ribosomal peptide synthetase n=1 Tax=Streptomyces sp. NBC_00568 TaxID=2975779 RepID=UPI00224E6409|nr:non-ribosomal peptide synthetase [Streptomyces sp. NBC_00568]MCX4993706.1 amino acid adenylation domain-containing protein [Streptomyces sp. NBC_00568]
MAPTTVVALWEQQAAATPDAVAVIAGAYRATYAEVDRRATALAAELQTRGIGPENLVGVCLGRSVELVVALLGILKSGAAYLPLDPSYPANRLRHMTTDARTGLWLCDADHRALALAFGAADVVLVEDLPAEPAAPPAPPAPVVHPHHLAYVIYTSGSTGLPKGVAVDHAAMSSFLRSAAERPGLGADDRVLALTPLSFDISVLELFLPLTRGAAVVMAPRAANTDPELLAATLAEAGVSVVQATPTTWRMLLASGWTDGRGRVLLSGGEPLDPQLARDLLATGGTLWNLYGPTEATVWAAATRIDAVAERVTVGTALSNTRLYVVDEGGREVGPGVTGELWIGGTGVARGYLNQPAQSADRFVPDPFGDGAGRLYRTGDLARWSAGGELEVLGRSDHQVKVRGFRIELGEIEACVRSHPLVSDAVVAVDREAAGGDQLVAYLVPAPDARNVSGDLPRHVRDHLARRLPAHMVAQGYAVLDALPRTPAGKADRGAVQRIPYGPVRANEPMPDDAPLPPNTAAVCRVWAEVLGLDDVSAHDDFFRLGGQSLTVVRAVARLRAELGAPVDAQSVFAHPTPAALAAALHGVAPSQDEPIPAAATAELSFGQERIWFFEQMNDAVPAYHLPVALGLPDGRVDLTLLRDSLSALVHRHPALRTAFVHVDGRVRPEPREPGPVPLRCTEVAEEDLDAVVTELISAPFALDRPPLLRADVLRTPSRDIIVLTIHHIACDGVSVDLMVRELGHLYTQSAAGRRPALAPLLVTYADYAAWQRERLTDAELERLLDHWRTRLSGVPVLELPTSRPRPAVASHRGRRELLRVPVDLAHRLRALCRAEGVTLFMGLLAPLQVLLGRYADEHDVAVGTLTGGRPRPELDDVVGYFVNTIVLRTDLSGDPTWRELLSRVREVARQAYAHQELPFEKLVAHLSPERDLSRNPLFQVLFALHQEPRAGYLTELYDRKELEGRLGTARFDLAFDVTDHAAGAGDLSISVEYATDLFDADFVQGLGRHFLRVIEQMVSDTRARLSGLEIVSADELRALSIGNRAEPLPEPTTLVRLWDRQVRTTPDATCVVGDGRSLTFAETDARASALARELRAGGVRPESLVGVCLERSVELVVALLGVLKAGGAYVPLDPGHPTDRLRYLLADSGVRLVVADPGHPTSALFGEDVRLVAVGQESRADPGEGPRADPEACPGAGPGPAEEARPHHLAYVIYTSGSTGNPKGVAITHANITGFLEWNQRLCRLTVKDRALLNHSVAFDNSVWEIFQCLVSGAELHLAGPTAAYDPEEFLREVAERGITTLNATPSQMRILLESGADAAPRLASVRLVFTGAEAVPHDVARRILSVTAPGCQVFNEYGPTEATVTSAFCPITDELLDRHSHRPSVPFGRATDNAQLYVLDPRLRPVAPGCRGELYVGGSAVGRGYLGKAARTAAAYLPDPYAAESGARMYATGDVVRLLPDGNLVFLGRNDHQVKVRGFRIELGEIESALRSHPACADCVVAVRRTRTGADQLAAYLVPERPDRPAPDPAELRAHLAEQLPPYMLPQSYTVIDEIPLSPNGKVDREALPDPRPVSASAPATRRAVTEQQRLVAEVWRECLGVEEDFGPQDDFFDVGGTSLTITTIARRLGERLGRRVPPVLVFRNPTVAGLAAALEEAGRTPSAG